METKYSVQLFEDNDLKCSWATIQVGWDLQCLDTDEITKFAIYFLERHPNIINEYISELIFGVLNYQIQDLLKSIFKSLSLEFPAVNSFLWNQEWRKWRYCIIFDAINNAADNQTLLMRIDDIYTNFGYPQDMRSLIYYLPSKDELSNQEAKDPGEHLVRKIHIFFKEEQKRIMKCYDILPPILYLNEEDVL